MATATAAGEEQEVKREDSGKVREPEKTGLGLPGEGEELRRRTEGTEMSKAASVSTTVPHLECLIPG